MRHIIALTAFLGALAALVHEVRAASEWTSMGSANGVEVFKFTDAGRTCYVTTPGGGISCSR